MVFHLKKKLFIFIFLVVVGRSTKINKFNLKDVIGEHK